MALSVPATIVALGSSVIDGSLRHSLSWSRKAFTSAPGLNGPRQEGSRRAYLRPLQA